MFFQQVAGGPSANSSSGVSNWQGSQTRAREHEVRTARATLSGITWMPSHSLGFVDLYARITGIAGPRKSSSFGASGHLKIFQKPGIYTCKSTSHYLGTSTNNNCAMEICIFWKGSTTMCIHEDNQWWTVSNKILTTISLQLGHGRPPREHWYYFGPSMTSFP